MVFALHSKIDQNSASSMSDHYPTWSVRKQERNSRDKPGRFKWSFSLNVKAFDSFEKVSAKVFPLLIFPRTATHLVYLHHTFDLISLPLFFAVCFYLSFSHSDWPNTYVQDSLEPFNEHFLASFSFELSFLSSNNVRRFFSLNAYFTRPDLGLWK